MESPAKIAWKTIKMGETVKKDIISCLKNLNHDFKKNRFLILSERDIECYIYHFLYEKYKSKGMMINAEVTITNPKKGSYKAKGVRQFSMPDLVICQKGNLDIEPNSMKKQRERIKIIDFSKAVCIEIKLFRRRQDGKTKPPKYSGLKSSIKEYKDVGFRNEKTIFTLISLGDDSNIKSKISEIFKKHNYVYKNLKF